MLRHGNLFSPVTKSEEEFTEILMSCKSGGARVERIVSYGHASPSDFWYDQDEWEFVSVLNGESELGFEDGTVMKMSSGDWVMIPAHCRHRVNMTSEITPCVWLCVFGKDC